jgi:DNA-binding transcriptional regulator YhcF (GntR family)
VVAAPPYARIAADIRARIDRGELKPGDRVPSTRRIVAEWGVAMATASKALATLRQDGQVVSIPGSGTVVADTPSRGERPSGERDLTALLIARAAVAVADVEGFRAVTIRRIAAALDVPPTSIYRHLTSRRHLLDAMQDAIFAEHPLPDDVPQGWRAQLELAARLFWSHFRRHPWLASAMEITRPAYSRNMLPHPEWILRALQGLHLDRTTVIHMYINLITYVHGAAATMESESEAQAHSGITNVQWLDQRAEELAGLAASGDFPVFNEVMFGAAAASAPMPDAGSRFEFGLQRLLDGYAALILAPRPPAGAWTKPRRAGSG